jgi:hypothetical protein
MSVIVSEVGPDVQSDVGLPTVVGEKVATEPNKLLNDLLKKDGLSEHFTA